VSNGASASGNAAAGVLICDDNESIRSLLSAIVDDTPGMHVVGEATDGNEAIVEAIRLQPSVILLDLAMPNRNGLEALPEIRRLVPNAQIIVFSGFATAAVAEQVLALGATSYLEKGAAPDVIVATIALAIANAPGLLQA
jgi:DNA-binding NarL/FixJ family response regulator